MKIRHLEGLRFEVEQRGHKIITDQPLPTGGDGGMTPVEFLGAALGACIAVYAADYLQRNGISMEGFEVRTDWARADRPKRLGAFEVKVVIPHELTARQQASLSRIVKACTVHNTLEHPPEITIELADAPH